jgi:ribosomal protein S18 acetylase RimI-like enzyme
VTERRILQTQSAVVRNVPMRPRDWQRLLDLDDTEAVEVDGGEMALVMQDGQLHLLFSFETNEVMKAAFNPMWAALQPQLQQYPVPYVKFDLVSFPMRAWIDQMLDEADFLPFAEWIDMEHLELGDVRPPEAPGGVKIRRATAKDHARILAIEQEAYGDHADGPEAMRPRLKSAGWVGVLEEGGEVVGYAVNAEPEDGVGRILSAAVASEARGRGLGQVIVGAAAYQLASRDARQALVRARPDIPRSVETARAVGFRAGRSGVELRRSLDEAANAARREQRHIDGMKVRFGNWR